MSSFEQTTRLCLKELFIKSFRNIDEQNCSFGQGYNIFVGKNGQGKTNCLEAIAIASSLRPMQALQNIDLIKFNEPQAKILASFLGSEHLTIEVDIFAKGKKAKVNDKPLKKISQLIESTSLVSFIPLELAMVSGPATLRRRALDHAASSLFFEHIEAQRAYEKLLLHRNKLLKDWPIDHKTLATFTQILLRQGAQVVYFRLKTIEHIENIFSEKVEAILGPRHRGNIRYFLGDQEICEHAQSDLMSLLNKEKTRVEQQEYKRKITLFGPHLDDVVFLLNGIDAKKSASRGQSRAIVLSFKLAQMIAIHRIRGVAPIIILDDIISELDDEKKANLIHTINDLDAQVFFSTTDLKTLGDSISCDRIYEMKDGAIKTG